MDHFSHHYNKDYFAWQDPIGEFGALANKAKFIEYIRKDDHVLDFGCGGGYLLKEINCKEKIGIEVNPSAREVAEGLDIKVVDSVDKVDDDWADVIISNNALEHTLQPLNELKVLHLKLKSSGLIVFIVPCESIKYAYKAGDINHHLYSWSPMCIGNLFTEAGFDVLVVKPYIHKWPPYYRKLARIAGMRFFNLCCRIYGRLERSWFQVRIIAKKPVFESIQGCIHHKDHSLR